MLRKNYKEDAIKESLLSAKRVAKVVKGGRRFSFSALVIAGDKKGRVGYGRRKAKEVTDAREKASRVARKDLDGRKIPIYQERTIHHDVFGRFGATKVIIRRAKPGTGIIAGGAMRSVLDILGVKDVVAKVFGPSNVDNVIKATFNALSTLLTPRAIAEKRGKTVDELSVSSSSFKQIKR
jgi:small subunit ribosomal protein S5